MRAARTFSALLCLAAAACSGANDKAAAPTAAQSLEGDQKLIASAQQMSDAIGGCAAPKGTDAVASKVVSLETGVIVMLSCGQGAYSFTNRLFAVRGGEAPQLLTLPDYDVTGWFATDQISMPELDAGTGVLTTFRKGAGDGRCGSAGRYQWDGLHFALQELQWRDCKDPTEGGPPFPVVWPVQTQTEVDPNGATPEP